MPPTMPMDPEDMMDNGADESQEADAPSMMGRRAALEQSLSGPMSWNPSTDNPAFDGSFTDATATPPKPVQYGLSGGGSYNNETSSSNSSLSGAPTSPSNTSPASNPNKPGQDFQQKYTRPDVKNEMISFLAQKARARAAQAAAYQSQSMAGQKSNTQGK